MAYTIAHGKPHLLIELCSLERFTRGALIDERRCCRCRALGGLVLRIECPYCGVRDEREFVFRAPSHVTRPGTECTDQEWTHYLYFRDNARGLHAERWCHSFGCGRWFNVLRDTLTHAIRCVYHMGESRPMFGGPERGSS